MPSLAPVIPLPAKPDPEVRCPDLTPAQWAAIWPLVMEDWQARMTSAGVAAAVLEASSP